MRYTDGFELTTPCLNGNHPPNLPFGKKKKLARDGLLAASVSYNSLAQTGCEVPPEHRRVRQFSHHELGTWWVQWKSSTNSICHWHGLFYCIVQVENEASKRKATCSRSHTIVHQQLLGLFWAHLDLFIKLLCPHSSPVWGTVQTPKHLRRNSTCFPHPHLYFSPTYNAQQLQKNRRKISALTSHPLHTDQNVFLRLYRIEKTIGPCVKSF